MAKAKHTIRIISGTHRSRRLPVLDFEGLRPTGDRVRETAFNWLQFEIADKWVLDLCAGTGALGFEAASRAAKKAVLVEKNAIVAKQLYAIEKEFQFINTQIVTASAQHFLLNQNHKYDLIFIDPPFAMNLWSELLEIAVTIVNTEGFIYLELPVDVVLPELGENWQLYRQKIFGKVKIELWKKH